MIASTSSSVVDKTTTIIACIVLGVAGFTTLGSMPILLGAMVDHLGFSEGRAGYVAAAENLGMFCASIITSRLIIWINRRTLVSIGIALAVVSNLVAIAVGDFQVMVAVRLLSGIGAGLLYAVAIATLANSQHSARNFMFFVSAQVLANALILFVFPQISTTWQISGLYTVICLMFVCSLMVVPLLPQFVEIHTGHSSNENTEQKFNLILPRYIGWMCLFAIFCFQFMIGAYWAYVERLGVELGYETEFLGSIMSIGALLTLLACVAAYWLSERFGQFIPLLSTLAMLSLAHLVFGFYIDPTMYFLNMTAVFLFWNFIDIYQLGTIANIDHTGKFAALVPGAQALPMFFAPSIAGFLLDTGFGYSSVILLWGVASLSAFTFYSVVYIKLRKFAPAIANSS